jgi:hypothetical protein
MKPTVSPNETLDIEVCATEHYRTALAHTSMKQRQMKTGEREIALSGINMPMFRKNKL